MTNSTLNCPEDFADEFVSTDGEAGLATLDFDDEAPEAATQWTGPCCEKCQAPLTSGVVTICRKCGWYASLGTFVELDPEWETELDETAPAASTRQASHLRVLIDLIPRWGWVIIGSVFVVIVESVVARLATPAGSSLRTMWSLTQLAIGVLTAVGCHVFNFLSLAADDADVGLLDLLLKPLKLWVRTCHDLPRRLQLVNATACGLVAAVMSLVVIGGIPYERLWDWGFKEPPKQNLVGAVMDRVNELESDDGSDNLEDAVGDFAGQPNLDADDLPQPEPPKPKEKADCVILGYQLDRDGRLTTLLLGAADHGQLVFAGRVTPKLSDDELNELLAALQAIATKQPLFSIPVDNTIWVKPNLTCRVSFAEKLKGGHLRDPQWDKMLGAMDVKP